MIFFRNEMIFLKQTDSSGLPDFLTFGLPAILMNF
jgi:hypothetical protein